jgi:hypothetical protein
LKGKVKDAAVRALFNFAAPALGIAMPMQVHLDTDEGNACMIQDAESYDLYRLEEKEGEGGPGGLKRRVATHVVHSKAKETRPARVRLAGSEQQDRPGAVRLPY